MPSGSMDLICGIDDQIKEFRVNNSKIVFPCLETYMQRDASWFNPDFMTENRLLLSQTVFDYTEVCTRRAQQEILKGGCEPYEVVDMYLSEASDFYDKIDKETSGAVDDVRLNFLADSVKSLLAVTELTDLNKIHKESLPEIMGFAYLGYQMENFREPVASAVDFMHCFNIGGGCYLGRLALNMDLMYGRGSVSSQSSLGYFYGLDKVDYYKGSLSAGLMICRSTTGNIIPFVGAGVSGFQVPDDSDDSINGKQLQFGVSVSLIPSHNIIFDWEGKKIHDTAIQARVYMAKNTFSDFEPSFWSLNFSIGLLYGEGI